MEDESSTLIIVEEVDEPVVQRDAITRTPVFETLPAVTILVFTFIEVLTPLGTRIGVSHTAVGIVVNDVSFVVPKEGQRCQAPSREAVGEITVSKLLSRANETRVRTPPVVPSAT